MPSAEAPEDWQNRAQRREALHARAVPGIEPEDVACVGTLPRVLAWWVAIIAAAAGFVVLMDGILN